MLGKITAVLVLSKAATITAYIGRRTCFLDKDIVEIRVDK
jgi:hypothetical protein